MDEKSPDPPNKNVIIRGARALELMKQAVGDRPPPGEWVPGRDFGEYKDSHVDHDELVVIANHRVKREQQVITTSTPEPRRGIVRIKNIVTRAVTVWKQITIRKITEKEEVKTKKNAPVGAPVPSGPPALPPAPLTPATTTVTVTVPAPAGPPAPSVAAASAPVPARLPASPPAPPTPGPASPPAPPKLPAPPASAAKPITPPPKPPAKPAAAPAGTARPAAAAKATPPAPPASATKPIPPPSKPPAKRAAAPAGTARPAPAAPAPKTPTKTVPASSSKLPTKPAPAAPTPPAPPKKPGSAKPAPTPGTPGSTGSAAIPPGLPPATPAPIIIVPESSGKFLAFIIGIVCVIALASGWIFYSFREQNIVHETSRAMESRIAAEKELAAARRDRAESAIKVTEARAEAERYRGERIVPQPYAVLVAPRTVVDLSTSAPPVAPTITTPAPLAPTPPTPSTTPPAPPNADQPRGSMEHHNPSGCRHHPHEHCACVWLNVQQLPPRITVFPGNIHWSSGPLMGNTYFKIEGVEGWWSNDR